MGHDIVTDQLLEGGIQLAAIHFWIAAQRW